MTRKDYILIAKALRMARTHAGNGVESDGVELAAGILARELKMDNPRFDVAKFYEAAGTLFSSP